MPIFVRPPLPLIAPFESARVPVKAVIAAPLAQGTRPSVIAIRGGTVLTVTKGTIPNGVVVLRDGKIAAVGASGVIEIIIGEPYGIGDVVVAVRCALQARDAGEPGG